MSQLEYDEEKGEMYEDVNDKHDGSFPMTAEDVESVRKGELPQSLKSKTRFDGRVVNGKEEWLTPPKMVEALGAFELDPCSAVNMPWVLARDAYTIEQDGLLHDWRGRVWLNPPYGNKTDLWMRRMAEHNEGIALTFARTETKMFFRSIWNVATGIYFIKGRIKFYNVDGTLGAYSGGAPSVLVSYGEHDRLLLEQSLGRLREAGWDGKYIRLK